MSVKQLDNAKKNGWHLYRHQAAGHGAWITHYLLFEREARVSISRFSL